MYEFRHERIDKKDNFIYYLKELEFRYNFMDNRRNKLRNYLRSWDFRMESE
jgi:hypothetical protein